MWLPVNSHRDKHLTLNYYHLIINLSNDNYLLSFTSRGTDSDIIVAKTITQFYNMSSDIDHLNKLNHPDKYLLIM